MCVCVLFSACDVQNIKNDFNEGGAGKKKEVDIEEKEATPDLNILSSFPSLKAAWLFFWNVDIIAWQYCLEGLICFFSFLFFFSSTTSNLRTKKKVTFFLSQALLFR